ncbi:hypothetical protein JCM16496A_09550 [Bacteroides rodentium JCM 16496]
MDNLLPMQEKEKKNKMFVLQGVMSVLKVFRCYKEVGFLIEVNLNNLMSEMRLKGFQSSFSIGGRWAGTVRQGVTQNASVILK